MARSNPTAAIAAASTALALGTTTLLIILVTGLSTRQHGLRGLAIASITFQFLSSSIIICFATGSWGRWSDNVNDPLIQTSATRKYLLLGTVLSILAAIFTFATLILTKVQLNNFNPLILERRPWEILLAVFIFWVALLVMQISLYVILHKRQRRVMNRRVSTDNDSSARTASNMTDANELSPVSVHHSLPRGPQEHSSPATTPRTVNGDFSLRSSLTLAVRPITSKTKLLPYQRIYLRSSTATASTVSNLNSSRQSQDSGLDTWDTSSVNPSIRETVLRSSPSFNNAAALSPIPGSRSPSPANLLQDFPLPPSSAPTSMPASPVLGPQHNFSRPCVRQRSASAESLRLAERSSSIAEEHIHPLFRTYSPSPAPSATPGTRVTAAPGSFEGLRINERSLHKMRSERSLPGSRSLHSPSSAGPSSPLVNSLPLSFPNEAVDDADDQAGCREEEARMATPTSPIPDFVLADSRLRHNR